jgi:AcrR family transcriptional regulator
MAGYGPRRAVQTPWGNVEELRERRLRSGPGTPREQVARDQRERLLAAMVTSVADKGYEATVVADLLELSGVSRSAFYEHFRDKEDCFLATFDAVVTKSIELASVELAKDDSPESSARAALGQVLDVVGQQPAAARLCFNDAYAAGKAGQAAVERAMGRFATLTDDAIARANGNQPLAPEMVHGLLGGVQEIVQFHLRHGKEASLSAITPDLWEWALGYVAPPTPLRLAGRQRRVAEQHPSPLVVHSQAERIIRALAAAAAERGYPGVTIGGIASRASISQATFYSHFADKDAALLAALDSAGAQTLAVALPAARRAVDWPHGVRAALGALCAFGVAEPDLVWLTAVGVHAAGRTALDQRERINDQLRDALAPGFELAPETKPIVADAVIGAVWALLQRQIAEGGPQSLPKIAPLASYMVLAPFIGAERACEIANGDGRRRR